ncbi:hypothetical protein Tco_0104416 [Tanacetum coccineum]
MRTAILNPTFQPILACIPNHDLTLEFAHYFGTNQPNAESDYDSKDMEEEVEYMTDDEVVMSEQEERNHEYAQSTQHFKDEDDVDEWLNTEIKKHMSMQKVKSKKDALISIIKSIRQEMRDGIKKREFEASTVNVSDEVSSIASNDIEKQDDNASNTAPCLPPEELSPRSFLLPFNIDNHNFYAATTLDAKDNIMPQRVYEYLGLDQLRGPVSLSPDRRGLVKRWHVCKPIHVTYDDGCVDMFLYHERRAVKGSYMGFADFLQVRYGQQKIDDTTRERRCYEWVAQNYEFDKHRTHTLITLSNHYLYNTNDPTPTPQEHWEQGENKLQPIRPRPYDYSFEEWLKIRIGRNNLHESDREFIFNEWILDSYDVEEEYANEIGNPYSRRFHEYNKVFNNEIKQLSNEYIIRI